MTVYTIDPETEQHHSVEVPPGYNLMGFETYRHELWGTAIMKSLGLMLLPSLDQGIWLRIETPEGLDQLERETMSIQANTEKIKEVLGENKVYSLEHTYIRNLLHAVQLARKVNGCVDIG